VKEVLETRKRISATALTPRTGSELAERRRNIFYDTDRIRETQKETVRLCDECSGTLGIDSHSDLGNHIYAVPSIPQ